MRHIIISILAWAQRYVHWCCLIEVYSLHHVTDDVIKPIYKHWVGYFPGTRLSATSLPPGHNMEDNWVVKQCTARVTRVPIPVAQSNNCSRQQLSKPRSTFPRPNNVHVKMAYVRTGLGLPGVVCLLVIQFLTVAITLFFFYNNPCFCVDGKGRGKNGRQSWWKGSRGIIRVTTSHRLLLFIFGSTMVISVACGWNENHNNYIIIIMHLRN